MQVGDAFTARTLLVLILRNRIRVCNQVKEEVKQTNKLT